MEYSVLKNSDLRVSRICMGGCPMGGHGWGDVQEKELIDAVHCALDNGINYFDTADTYGLGQSEKTLSKALGSHRHEVVIQSKFGVRYENGKSSYDNSPAYIRKALEGTLTRLNTDYVDVYVIHYRDKITPISDIVETLSELKSEGKLRYFGLSNVDDEQIKELLPYKGAFVCCQDEYSLACRKHQEELIVARDILQVTPLTWGSLGQGILTGKYDSKAHFEANDRRSRDIYVNFHGEKLLKNLEIVEAMKPIAEKHGVPVSAVAIRFILDYLKDSVVLFGAKRSAQVLGNVGSMGWELSQEELNLLDSISK